MVLYGRNIVDFVRRILNGRSLQHVLIPGKTGNVKLTKGRRWATNSNKDYR